MNNLLIKNGYIVDVDNKKTTVQDVAISNGKIVQIGTISAFDADTVIDATGLYVLPGFIDFHSHADLTLFGDLSMQILLKQGVTTFFGGLCGLSLAPYSNEFRQVMYHGNIATASSPSLCDRLQNVCSYQDLVKLYNSYDFGCNMFCCVGLGNIRASVVGYSDAEATDEQLQQMCSLVEEAMTHGAFGLSAGFIYPPDVFVSDRELVAMLKVVAKYNGIFNVHMWSESDGVVDSLNRCIDIAKVSKVKLHISHHKVAGVKNWGKSAVTLDIIDKANKAGVAVTVDVYPYTASCSTLKNIIPPRYFTNGVEGMLQCISTPEGRCQVTYDIQHDFTYENQAMDVGWDRILVLNSQDKNAIGLSISQYADKCGIDAFDTAYNLLLADKGVTLVAYFSMSEDDVDNIVTSQYSCFGSDGAIFEPGVSEHPRCSSNFIRVFDKLVRDGTLDIYQAVHKCSQLPAQIAGLQTKGKIALGYDADIVMIDLDTIKENATYLDMNIPNDGVINVIVNGQLAINNKKLSGVKNGKYICKN